DAGFDAAPERGLRQDLPQDRLVDAGVARRDPAIPARVLHRRARLPGTRAAVRQGARRQVRRRRAEGVANAAAIAAPPSPSRTLPRLCRYRCLPWPRADRDKRRRMRLRSTLSRTPARSSFRLSRPEYPRAETLPPSWP